MRRLHVFKKVYCYRFDILEELGACFKRNLSDLPASSHRVHLEFNNGGLRRPVIANKQDLSRVRQLMADVLANEPGITGYTGKVYVHMRGYDPVGVFDMDGNVPSPPGLGIQLEAPLN